MNISLVAGGACLAGLIIELIVLFFFLRMLAQAGAVRENYLGHEIPVGTGISFVATMLICGLTGAVLQRFLNWPVFNMNYLYYIFGVIGISFLGFIDDMLGSRDTLGFRGHIGELMHGRMTTGGLKAAGGFCIALTVGFFTTVQGIDWALNAFIMALFTNMMNLFDLRPGRALKAYFVFLAAIILIALGNIDYILAAPLTGAVIAYLPFDLKARSMMGDAGSNVLGFSLGFWAVLNLSLSARVALLLFLIVMHLFTERFSLTRVIENNRFLNRVDQFGR